MLPRQGRQLHIRQLADESLGLTLQSKVPDRMTGTVPGHLHGFPQILQLHVQHVHQELGQFVDTGAEGTDLGLVRLPVEQLG